ncbi:sigma-70 family RNA polymerase sigma factor [Salipaludibacillus sp. CUR1]|uniref:sigma-70 family RNA polymerase sigma factor n=1 Tax=Salipaludibacillus sp. CUR1 TaxID=2820003 RepID=UPI001E58233B|nr:sigma-70 family RNA polymerase sigma factor [Salipaludibacillus sp. CUR1]
MYQSKLTEGNNSFEQTNEHVLQELMSSYGQQIQQLAYTYVKDPALAEDLTQEIFLKAYTKLHTYNGEASMKTWLYRIAINHCKDYVKSWHYRKVTLHAPAIDTAKTKGHSLEQEVINRSEQERIVQAVLQLPIKYRESVYLYYY